MRRHAAALFQPAVPGCISLPRGSGLLSAADNPLCRARKQSLSLSSLLVIVDLASFRLHYNDGALEVSMCGVVDPPWAGRSCRDASFFEPATGSPASPSPAATPASPARPLSPAPATFVGRCVSDRDPPPHPPGQDEQGRRDQVGQREQADAVRLVQIDGPVKGVFAHRLLDEAPE